MNNTLKIMHMENCVRGCMQNKSEMKRELDVYIENKDIWSHNC